MSEQETLGHMRILLADDQQEVRETVKLLLDLDGHTVTEACNGREALSLFRENQYDLVITDYAMPLMRGDELAANVKQVAPGQRVLMITGSVEKFGAPDMAVDRLLNKPFTFEELRRAVAQVFCPTPGC